MCQVHRSIENTRYMSIITYNPEEGEVPEFGIYSNVKSSIPLSVPCGVIRRRPYCHNPDTTICTLNNQPTDSTMQTNIPVGKRNPHRSAWKNIPREEHGLEYRNAIEKRYNSVYDLIACKCMYAIYRPSISKEDKQRLYSVIEHAKKLWIAQEGKCKVTGRPLVITKEDVAIKPHASLTVACLRKNEYGDAWVEGNIALVCSGIRGFIAKVGFDNAIVIARSVVRFALFQKDHNNIFKEDTFEMWDKACASESGIIPWEGMTREVRRDLKKQFMTGKTVDDDIAVLPGTKQLKKTIVRHAIDLYCIQRGRCAISGTLFEVGSSARPMYKPSVDRIDCSKPHGIGNIMLTTRHINHSRSNLDISEFFQLIRDVAQSYPIVM
jgi:hypothetical protein